MKHDNLSDNPLLVADDGLLLERLCSGHTMAFTTLVHRHSTRFYRVAYRFTGNRQEAEDIVQEAFLKLWTKPAAWQVERNTKFTTWFYRIVVNLCLDHKKKKRPVALVDDHWVADERAGADDTLYAVERQHLLDVAIAALPERQRTALNLCVYEELSNQEAAEVMGIRLKALQSLLIRAKTTLKETLGGTA